MIEHDLAVDISVDPFKRFVFNAEELFIRKITGESREAVGFDRVVVWHGTASQLAAELEQLRQYRAAIKLIRKAVENDE